MQLAETTQKALEATEGLRAALVGADSAAVQELVLERGEIMMHFENAHRRASVPERLACEPAIVALQEGDRGLMRECQAILMELTEEFRGRCDSAGPGAGRYREPAQQACVNRTA